MSTVDVDPWPLLAGARLDTVLPTAIEGGSLSTTPAPAASDPAARSWLDVVATAAAILTVILVIMTVFGFLGPWWWFFDLFANLRLHLAVGLLLLTLVLTVFGSRRALVAAAIGVLLNLLVVVPALASTQFGTPEPADAGAETLDVTFFNTKFRADSGETIAQLASREDDVVVLSLALGDWVEELEESELDLHVRTGPDTDPDFELELVTLTRDPDAEVIVHRPTDKPRDALVEVVVELEGGPIHVLAGHPMSPLTPERASQRDAMLAWIADWMQERDEPVVLMGDLNATSWSAPLRRLLDDGDLVDSRVGHGLQPSWPARFGPLGLAIDHVLHSPELTTVDRQLAPPIDSSDHRMVHATIAHRDPDA
jgi:endonuclease/exonuclease/phosphatase (EEP) superfamily protein YafD